MSTSHASGRLVTLGNLASELGIQAKFLREAAEAGEIPCVRVGGRGMLFDGDLVERLLLERARAAAAASTDPRPQREEVADGQAR